MPLFTHTTLESVCALAEHAHKGMYKDYCTCTRCDLFRWQLLNLFQTLQYTQENL